MVVGIEVSVMVVGSGCGSGYCSECDGSRQWLW